MKELKILTYNIDGLPEQLDLNDLPIILKPIAFIYKLFKKTTIIKVNDNTGTKRKMLMISKNLFKSSPDIIGVQEDFNYHDELINDLHDYTAGTYTGGFDLSKVFSSVEIISHFPFPRFKADGLNVFVKDNAIKINDEDIVTWNKSYGYVDHANDLLTHKGFRFYNITYANNIDIDLYLVHMDADFYNPEKCPDVSKDVEARKSQLEQLKQYIINRLDKNINNPIIIFGDTNSYNKHDFDVKNLQENLIDSINNINHLHIEEVVPDNFNDCDRIFIINNDHSKYLLIPKKCNFNFDFDSEEGRLSDHKPLEAILSIKEMSKKY